MGVVSSPLLVGRGMKWWDRWQVQGGDRKPKLSPSAQNPVTLPASCPVAGVQGVNWPMEDRQRKGREGSQPGMWLHQTLGSLCRLRLRSSPRTGIRWCKMLEPVGARSLITQVRVQECAQVTQRVKGRACPGRGTPGHCPSRLPPPLCHLPCCFLLLANPS